MNIGVFFGGKSPEHDVSIITGQLIISELKKMGREVTPIYLTKHGEWCLGAGLDALNFFSSNPEQKLNGYSRYAIDLEESKGKIVFRKKAWGGKKTIIDLAFPAFHGMNGEDGTIQGLFEMFNLPYVGCDVAASALAMDKILTKEIYLANNILTADFIYFTGSEWLKNKSDLISDIEQKMKYPIFVKPPKLGSSIGITKAKTRAELENGIEVALHYGTRVLVEAGINNLKDITCAILGNDDPQASAVQESNFGGEFFDYEEKYLNDGGAQLGNSEKSLIIPASLDPATTRQVQEMAVKIYKIIGGSGTARVDFLYDAAAGRLFANEINTLPGTLYHHLWKASGVELDELISKLISLAQSAHKYKNDFQNTFESDILKFANSIKLKSK